MSDEVKCTFVCFLQSIYFEYFGTYVNVAWETNSRRQNNEAITSEVELVPAQLQMLFQIERDDTIYCIIHSCHSRSQYISVLTDLWMKMYDDIPISEFNKYRDCDIDNCMTGNKPSFTVIEMEAIESHCLLVPYQKNSCFFIKVKKPELWPDEFHEIY